MRLIAICRKQWARLFLAALLASLFSESTSSRPIKTGVKQVVAPLTIAEATFARDVCALIANRSKWRGINPHFIVRLIDVESRFSPNAVSPAGAEGIAQFIPGTAQRRGLKDPYDPAAALTASIDFLAHLKAQFGNLGLAAIAYNAGEGAAARFMNGAGVPFETENYVYSITGRVVDAWRKPDARYDIPRIHPTKPFAETCPEHVKRPGRVKLTSKAAPSQPWGVLISEHFSRNQAINIFKRTSKGFPADLRSRSPMVVTVRNLSMGSRPRYSARIGAANQIEAGRICASLRTRAIFCLVLKTK